MIQSSRHPNISETDQKLLTGIRDLYIKNKDRVGRAPTQAELEKERQELNGVDSMWVLEAIGNQLKDLRSFHDRFESRLIHDEIHGSIQDNKALTSLQEEVKNLRQCVAQSAALHSDALVRTKPTNETNQQLLSNARITIDALRGDNETLINHLRLLQDEMKIEKDKLVKAQLQISQQNIKLQKVSMLNSRMQSMKAQGRRTVLQITNAQENEINRLQEELKSTKLELNSYKRDFQRCQLIEANKKLEKVEQKVIEKEQEMSDLKRDLRNAQRSAEILAKRNLEMKQEYDKLFTAASDEKKKFSTSSSQQSQSQQGQQQSMQLYGGSSVGNNNSQINSNFGYLMNEQGQQQGLGNNSDGLSGANQSANGGGTDLSGKLAGLVSDTPAEERVYQRIISLQEGKIKSLTNEVRRLMASDRRAKILAETRSIERARYETELAALKMKMGFAEGGQRKSSSVQKDVGAQLTQGLVTNADILERAQTMSAREIEALLRRNMELEEMLVDYKNVKAVNETVTSAYERILHSSNPAQVKAALNEQKDNENKGNERERDNFFGGTLSSTFTQGSRHSSRQGGDISNNRFRASTSTSFTPNRAPTGRGATLGFSFSNKPSLDTRKGAQSASPFSQTKGNGGRLKPVTPQRQLTDTMAAVRRQPIIT
ncbi:MAG: hypothetical protein EZS28_024210 [Streblomastix strix]|uniref:REKLES domain-containing protein n=1 Tax=Streblomastix strix TaxID=222440 RepID=A0A5J4VCM2_9EUKA|nr:MAG: hypothetical protein EZS28_024210 [Streblomastix strix]